MSTRLPHQLPPGRHGLPRSFVIGNQRERILDAVAEVSSSMGYAAMAVEDIVACAGVSRRTFYDQFTSKEHAFLEAYDEVTKRVTAAVRHAQSSAVSFATRTRVGIETFLLSAASEPAFAELCVAQVLAAGPRAIQRRDATMRDFAGLIADDARALLAAGRPPDVTAEIVVGGLYEAVRTHVAKAATADIAFVVPDLVFLALLPYVGHDAARRERECSVARTRHAA